MKYARFDNAGLLVGRYDDAVHQVLDDAGQRRAEFADLVEMDDEIFVRTIIETDGVWKLVDDQVVKASHPAPTLSALKAALTEAATAKRWEVETGGVVLPSGVRVQTSKADQDRITSVLVNAGPAGVTSVDFKAASGWVTLSITELGGIAAAIALHVQACFTAERTHHEAIAALATVQAAEAYDIISGWPS